MKIAILYTGELRTVDKTIQHFKKNILLNSDVHVFAVVQSPTELRYQKFLNKEIGTHLKTLQWFRKNDSTWINIRDHLLSDITSGITDYWLEYLRTGSGSMIEYYQLHLAYIAMYEYEKTTKTVYDYVVRLRPDTIITEPLDFAWLNWTIDDLNELLAKITTDDPITEIMNNLIKPKRINKLKYGVSYIATNDILLKDLKNDFNTIKLLNYIKNGSYAIILHCNITYIVKRKLFSKVPALGYSYALLTTERSTENQWFNAETQLKYVLLENNLTIFDSTTLLEENSMYKYHQKNYFLYDEITLRDSDDVAFFLCRY